jgi:hypothetical protein
VDDQLAELLVRHGRLANLAVEVDVLEDAVEGEVLVLQVLKGLVEAVADRLMQVPVDLLPAGTMGT